MYVCILGLNINISMYYYGVYNYYASIFINTEVCAISQHNHVVSHEVKAEEERRSRQKRNVKILDLKIFYSAFFNKVVVEVVTS